MKLFVHQKPGKGKGMRKYQQQQLLELFKTIKRAQSAGLFADCQSGAKAAGAFIESIEGADNPRVAGIIALLEEYRELLYRAGKGEAVGKQLRRHLIKTEQSVRTDLTPDKIEIVFFPYQAAMWDSFESVYLAAKNDPGCDAYCVPIPWFERKPDGSFGTMHYDGDQYPADITVTDWRRYDVKARRPDAIFIHNAYDGYNFVTSVHPGYYSDRLKGFTDLLVYIEYGIPYYAPNDPERQVSPENTHILPGHHYCDLFPMHMREQAEAMRLIFKHLYRKRPVREKVIALGSAKFDKVINTAREGCELPEAWVPLINGRKVLLYCTSLADLLQGNESYLKKIRSVIEALENRADIVLWWRPHPLCAGTFRSMRPGLLEEYEAITAAYRNRGLGVYDDTAGLHRAIAWSDACLTDKSSVMFLYLATGKPFSVTTVGDALPDPIHSAERDFSSLLKQRIKNMKAAKGANVFNWPLCIWWDNFSEEDKINNIHFDNFLEGFVHFTVHRDAYPEAEEYRQLQLQIYSDFIVNSDGSAGRKIYAYCKQRMTGGSG
jgi:hypothetical protein